MGYSSRVGICISQDAADFLDAKIRVLSPALKEEVARLFEDADVKNRMTMPGPGTGMVSAGIQGTAMSPFWKTISLSWTGISTFISESVRILATSITTEGYGTIRLGCA